MKANWLAAGCLGLLAAIVLTAASQPPGRDKGGDDKKFGRKDDGPDRKGPPPPPRWELGKILPPFVCEQLEISEDQHRQIAELEKDVRAKMLKILTTEQKDKLSSIRYPGPPPGGRAGPPRKDGGRDGPPRNDGKGPPRNDRERKGPPPPPPDDDQ